MNVFIRHAKTAEDIDQARELFRAYAAYLSGNSSSAANICINGFEQEIASLPEPYASPAGTILLASVADVCAGCVALRPMRPTVRVEHEGRSCEMKRLFLSDGYRGLGLGRILVQSAIQWAQAASYRAMYLDTAPAAMPAAMALYQGLGFEQIERYNDNPVPGIVFFRLNLTKDSSSQDV